MAARVVPQALDLDEAEAKLASIKKTLGVS